MSSKKIKTLISRKWFDQYTKFHYEIIISSSIVAITIDHHSRSLDDKSISCKRVTSQELADGLHYRIANDKTIWNTQKLRDRS